MNTIEKKVPTQLSTTSSVPPTTTTTRTDGIPTISAEFSNKGKVVHEVDTTAKGIQGWTKAIEMTRYEALGTPQFFSQSSIKPSPYQTM